MKILNSDQLHYRTKDRIRNLGEVFTPEKYVEDMLDLLAKGKSELWSDEEITFFEPCCGHGNIVILIYKRRLEAIYQKSLRELNEEASYYAVANALNTLWAIDIDSKNIENCRTRILSVILNFLRKNVGPKSDFLLFTRRKDFFAHILSAIRWHIDENETMSALSNKEKVKINVHKTKSGAKWFSDNGHHEMDFNLTWVEFYKQCRDEGTIPLDYERAVRFIDSISNGSVRVFADFSFAKLNFTIENSKSSRNNSHRILMVGA